MKLEDHPTVKRYRERAKERSADESPVLDAAELRDMCLTRGADDAGVVAVDTEQFAGTRAGLEALLPGVRSAISLVHRLKVVQPLRERVETVYVVAGSDGEAHALKRFPHKRVKRVGSGIRPASIRGFLGALPQVFNRDQAAGLSATYHLSFRGEESCEATVQIREGRLLAQDGLVGEAHIHVTADSRLWLRFLSKEKGIASAMLTGAIRVKGSPRLMSAFGKCFPL